MKTESPISGWTRIWMPYHLSPMGGGLYLPVNREYVPLGMTKEKAGWVDYRQHLRACMRFNTRIEDLEGIWWKQSLLLYDDSAESKLDYEIRLGRLLSLCPLQGPLSAEEWMERE